MSESSVNTPTPPNSTKRRESFILTLWVERPAEGIPVWRGYVESGSRQRLYFDSLVELEAIVHRISDWMDPVS